MASGCYTGYTIQIIQGPAPARSHSAARSTCCRNRVRRMKRRNLDTSTRASPYRRRTDQRRYIRTHMPPRRSQRNSRRRHQIHRCKRPCSPRRNSSVAAEAPAATRRLERLGPKNPHQNYASEDDADTDIPRQAPTCPPSRKSFADARGRSESSRPAQDTSTGSPGRRGGTRTLPDKIGTTAYGLALVHRDSAQASRAVSRSGYYEHRPPITAELS